MNDKNKTREQFIEELAAMRKRVAELEASDAERKQAEEQLRSNSAVLESINKVFQETLVCETVEEIAHTCINLAEELTGSEFGLIGEINEAGNFDTLSYGELGWAICKMPESNAIALSKNMIIRGIWGQAIVKGKSQIVNDPASHPDRVGTPDSHPQVNCFMGVPLKYAGKTIGLIGLANKEGGYGHSDQEAVESLSAAFVEALKRKQAEEALRESEVRFRGIYESEMMGTLFWDANGDIIDANDAFLQMVGYTRDEILSGVARWRDMTPPEYKEQDDKALEEVATKGAMTPIEKEYIRKDGSRIPIFLGAASLPGPALSGVAFVLDITDKKRAEEARDELLYDMSERVKELDCLYGVSKLVAETDKSLEEIFQETVNLIPPSWQYPDIACARIVFEEHEFKTKNFTETKWKMSADIIVAGKKAGVVDVCYLEEMTGIDEGPFVKEERDLIDDLGRQLGAIAERKRAEEALKESEATLKLMIKNSLDVIFRIELDKGYTYMSPSVEQLMGYHPEDYYNDPEFWRKITFADDIPKVEAMFADIMEGKDPPSIWELRQFGKDGNLLHLEFTTVAIHDEADKIVALEGVARDITERKRAEEKLRASEAKLIEAQRLARLGDVTWDIVTGEVTWSEGMCYLMGYDPNEKDLDLTKVNANIHHPDDLERVTKWLEDCLASGKEKVTPNEYRVVRKDGEAIWIHTEGTLEYKDGKPVKMFGACLDITDRKRVEEKLKEYSEKLEEMVEERTRDLVEAQERFNGIFNSSKDAIGYSTLEGTILDLNDAFCELTGYSREEWLGGKTYQEITPEEYQEYEGKIIGRIIRTGKPEEYEKEYIRKDGSRVPISLTTFVVKGADGRTIGIAAIIKDITERKQIQDALSEERERLEVTLRSIGDGMIATDVEGKITILNKAAESLTGWTQLAAIGKPLIDIFNIINQKTRMRCVDPVAKVLETGEIVGLANDTVLVARDGTERIIADSGAPIHDTDGKVIGVVLVFSDTTKRKQAEEALRESEKNYQTLYNNSLVALFRVSLKDQKVLYANNLSAELFGYASTDEFIREFKSVRHYANPEDREPVLQKLKEKGFIDKIIIPSKKKDGTFIWNESSFRVNTEDAYVDCMAIDTTKRKLAEDALSEERERLSVTLRSIGDGMIATDAEGKITILNKAAESLTGWTQEEALGKPLIDIFNIINEKTRERCIDPVEMVLKTGEIVGLANDTVLVARDGTERIIADSGAPIHDTDGKVIGVVLVFSDITERKEMQERLLRSEKLAVLGQLAGGVGHELRNPLGAIKNAAYFLNMVLEEPEPEVKETLEVLEKEVNTSEKIISSLLGFARPKPPTRRKVNLNEVLQDALSRATVPENVKVEKQLDEALPTILADPVQLTQVFGNIILNALQAMPEGGRLTIESEASGEEVIVSITDTGVGIFERDIGKLFEPLFTTKAKGIGLGLALARTLVEASGGSISVESKEEKGSSFKVIMPTGNKEGE